MIAANQDLIGNVTVVGHTDSIPVSGANPFDDNQGLSEARAATIARILVANGAPADRVRSEGRAATEPVASNKTSGGPRAEPPRRDPRREAALRWSILRFLWAFLTSRWLWTPDRPRAASALIVWLFGPLVGLGDRPPARRRDRAARRSSSASSSSGWSG